MIHNTHFAQFIPPSQITKSAGTWTMTLATHDVYERRTAADANFNLFVPVRIPSNSVALQGARLESIELIFNITTAGLDDFAAVTLKRLSFSAAGASTASDITVTLDAANDTANERRATGTHRMRVTLSTPAWVDNDDTYWLHCTCDAAAGSVFDLYGAIANFTLKA